MHYFQLHSRKLSFAFNVLYVIFGLLFILRPFVEIQFLSVFKVFPLLLLLLTMAVYRTNKTILKVMFGLFFGVLGDQVLEYGGAQLFCLGAGFFLIGHLFYNIAIMELWQGISLQALLKRKTTVLLGSAFLLSATSINMTFCVSDQLKVDAIIMLYLLPVYLVFLSMLCLNSLFLVCGSPRITGDLLLLINGTIFFLISDNILGKSIFGGLQIAGDIRINSVVIMITYYIAQYCIVHGIKGLSLKTSSEITAASSLLTASRLDNK